MRNQTKTAKAFLRSSESSGEKTGDQIGYLGFCILEIISQNLALGGLHTLQVLQVSLGLLTISESHDFGNQNWIPNYPQN